MLPDAHAEIHPGEQSEAQAYELPPTLACGLACARTNIRGDAHIAIRPNAQADAQCLPKGNFCEKGFLPCKLTCWLWRVGQAHGLRPSRIARQLAAEFATPQTSGISARSRESPRSKGLFAAPAGQGWHHSGCALLHHRGIALSVPHTASD
jgi:hypothetical protein